MLIKSAVSRRDVLQNTDFDPAAIENRRENRAGPKDRGRRVRFSSRYYHIMILASQAV